MNHSTAPWAVFYQTVAGAAIIPLYYLAYAVTSREKDYLAAGRQVPLGCARALLPALVVGYLVPTIALYIPWGDLSITQNLTALWQIAPALPNVLLLVLVPLLSPSLSSTGPESGTSTTRDVRHLKRIYLVIGIASTITQLATWYICLTSTNPQLSLSYVFLPNKALWKESAALGLHYIFQWDFWIIYASSLAWCWLVVMDALTKLRGRVYLYQRVLAAGNILLVTLVAGPGTALALVWNAREETMLEIEQAAQKPKAT